METAVLRRSLVRIFKLVTCCGCVSIFGFVLLIAIIYLSIKPDPIDVHLDLSKTPSEYSVTDGLGKLNQFTGIDIPAGATVEISLHVDFMGFDEQAWWLRVDGDRSSIEDLAEPYRVEVTQASREAVKELQELFFRHGSKWIYPSPNWLKPEELSSVEVANVSDKRLDWMAIYGPIRSGSWAFVARGFTWPPRSDDWKRATDASK